MRNFRSFRSLRREAIAVIAFLICLQTTAFAEKYGFDVWTTANGLPQNSVTGVVQTADGYLWLSTFDGLARFDGVRFTIFDKGNTKGILNNRFSSILVDNEGVIWAITENGVVTSYRDGVFTSFPPPENWTSSVGLVSDSTGRVMFEAADSYFYIRDGKFVPLPETIDKSDSHVSYSKSGSKWIFRKNVVIREKDGNSTDYDLALPDQFVSQFYHARTVEEKNGALWIQADRKLYRLANGSVSTISDVDIPALRDLTLQVGLEDADGVLWFVFGAGTFTQQKNGQLVKFKDGRFTSFALEGFTNATSGIVDREGNFWLATPTALRRLRKQLITTLSVKDGLNADEVYPLLQTADGAILIGTTKGINRYAEGKLTDLGLKYGAGFPLYMRGLWQDPTMRIWLGYQGESGIGRMETPGSVKRIGNRELPNGATNFTIDGAGIVWIATEEGLLKYQDDRETARFTISDGLRNDKIITVHVDRNDTVWLGTFDGLSCLKNGKIENFAETDNAPKGFVRAIYEDGEGVLWFGTYGDGLVQYKDGRFFNYRVEDGLFNNGVFAILEDARGNFWMSSNRGVHRVSRQDLNDYAAGKISKLNSVSYDEDDGMLNAECNGGRIPAGIKTRDGQLWFATMGGVAIVDPESERFNPVPPPVIIESVAIDRKTVEIKGSPAEIELMPGQTNLTIEYTGLSLLRSEQARFKYKLEGLDDNWIDAGTKRGVDYSYLPAGNYTFRVIAANANGVWNNEGAFIKVIVRPFFYQTWWFLALSVFAIVLVVVLVYRNRVSRLREIANAKTNFSRQLIESQEAERKRIATELHDGLGQSLVVIKNRAMLGIKKGDDRERVSKELGIISESASLALDEVRAITNNLRPQLLDRLGLTKAINSMLKNVADVVEVRSEIDPIDDIFEESEEISVFRIIQESLNNVIKHSNATSAVVRVKSIDGKVLITVEDNGDGFDVSTVKNGLGLTGLKERAQLLSGSILVDSIPGRGTKIEIGIERKTV